MTPSREELIADIRRVAIVGEIYELPPLGMKQWYGVLTADGVRHESNLENIQKILGIYNTQSKKDEELIKRLRSEGVKAAHPDDGWHEREKHYIQLSYPLFNDGVDVGDRIALTRPTKTYKIIRIEKCSFGGLDRFYYEYQEPMPPEKESSFFEKILNLICPPAKK